MVVIATTEMAFLLNNSQMGLWGGPVATPPPPHPHLPPSHRDLWDVLLIIFCPASPFQNWQAERKRIKLGILPTSVEGLWCGKLCCDSLDRKFEKKKRNIWRVCWIHSSQWSWKVCDKWSYELCKVYNGKQFRGRVSNRHLKRAVNNNFA